MKLLMLVNTKLSNTMDISETVGILNAFKELGHEVTAFETDGDFKEVMDQTNHFDFIFIAKNIIYRASHIRALKREYDCPIIYWMSDYIDNFSEVEPWVKELAEEVDIWLGIQMDTPEWFRDKKVKYHFWNFCNVLDIFRERIDSRITSFHPQTPYPNVVPVGIITNWTHNNYRTDFLYELQKQAEVHITTSTVREFVEAQHSKKSIGGLKDVHHGLHGENFSKLVNITKINLSLPWEVQPGCVSANIGRYMVSGGFVLAQYLPGMEITYKDYIIYFKDLDDCVEKIKYWLAHDEERKKFSERGRQYAEWFLRPVPRIKELIIYLENYGKSVPL